jgi:alkanesulfonate monooxygenase SsuD/methylene tetrahydromethanopterin reductase-like flavin-dependent oxidoreductase (luciferase family)
MPPVPDRPVPLSILDLAPVVEGSTHAQALRNSLDLARHAEEAGYLRYWVAEHHFSPGVAAASPAVLIAAIAAVTSRIRVGSGAVQLGHQTPLAVVEAFGTLSGLYPGRIDLGLGRSGQRRLEERRQQAAGQGADSAGGAGSAAAGSQYPGGPRAAAGGVAGEARVVNGLLIPRHYSQGGLLKSPRFALNAALLQQPGAVTPDFGEQVNDILAFLADRWRSADGISMTAVPGAGADAEVWILGSSGGQSAQVAGALGLPFAANYHVSPSTVLEAAQSYRSAFRPSTAASAPHVMVSADVVVAPSDAAARELAAGYGLWVRSVRSPAGATQYPSPQTAAAHRWTEHDAALVEDRVATQFVGSPGTVAKSLRILQDVSGADELLVTTITHSHADRVRSFQLLARKWGLS